MLVPDRKQQAPRSLRLTVAIAVWLRLAPAFGLDGLTLPQAPVPYEIGGQTTVVWQHLPPFHSRYEGPHSLLSRTDDAVSHSYTLYAGIRLQPWLEVYVNPEMIRGSGVGGGFGLAGYTNGEVIRNPSVGQDPYLGRAFVRATIPLGDATEPIDTGLNTIAGTRPLHRLTVTAGILGVTDIFDTNRYANNTRLQFMNWALLNNVAWDFAADTRGYTRGAAIEWTNGDWAARLGTFQMPTVANGAKLDGDVPNSHGDQVEVEAHPTLLPARPLIIRVLAYENRARMGNYREAVALARGSGAPPRIERTRSRDAVKYGLGLNIEQPLDASGDTGLFARLGWNDGATESFAFTEAERTATIGAQVGGALWQRATDALGIAVAVNGLSAAHADYLAAGGIGFALGDGALHYAPETIFESYYAFALLSGVTLTADYQLIGHPGYNRDRGPVSVVSLRVHLEAFASQ